MAAVLTSSAPSAGSDSEHQYVQVWVDAFNDVIEQLNNGIVAPVVDLKKLEEFGFRGAINWAVALGKKINARVEAVVDLLGEKITVYPLGPMPTDATAASIVGGGAREDGNAVSKEKVARPPNSFIIYRQEWHPKVVKAHPGMHNNDISKLIARKWKAETEAVKNEYKRKAEDAKRQHAIDHPGYQYQPRKPFEKKKRMTKNKLAKLKAQADAAAASDPMNDLDEMLAKAANDKQVTIGEFQAPYRQGFPNLQPSQEVNNHLTFDANDDHEMLLYNQLVNWNAGNPLPSGGPFPEPAVLVGQPLADGQKAIDVPQPEVPYSFTQVNDMCGTAVAAAATTNASAMCFHDATAEVERQDRISKDAINELINFEACADPVVEGDDAESALQNFQGSYWLDFEQGGSFHF